MQKPFRYRAFGLGIASDIELPQLRPSEAEPEVQVSAGPVPEALEAPAVRGVRFEAGPGDYLLSVDRVARFRVTAGEAIRYERQAGASDEQLRVFLLGRPIGALLLQRGLLPLHAGAVRVGDGCVAFAGPSGVGKSTLVAALGRRGYHALTDEMCALALRDGRWHVQPGATQIKLWQDSARRLGEDPERLTPVRPEARKFWLAADAELPPEGLPLRRLYVLRTSNAPEVEIVPLRGTQRIQAFLNDTYAARLLEGFGRKAHFATCAQAAQQASVHRVRRPRAGFAIERLVTALEQDFPA